MAWYWPVGVPWPPASDGLALALQHDLPVPSSASTELVLVEDVRVSLEEVTIYDRLGFQIQPLPCQLPGAADDIKTAYQETRASAMFF
ncbi:nuclear pore membrane glycoprotein 210-like isoform X3 [Sapajus apella]|uniref:Nuclear pore membrane glycoprotein 210-like isoform X3 n=1 Tax=Sapajus apella TaxID=9515 RepID=A0A6J3HDD4_SAPAP|nr:nuclear pore membrane glycoprotein 210-like isoform X3 [Sapajus apella]